MQKRVAYSNNIGLTREFSSHVAHRPITEHFSVQFQQ